MSTESLNNMSEVEENSQPEKIFNKHIASLIDEFKLKIPDHIDVIIMMKSSESEEAPIVYMKGHMYDIAVMGTGLVRELKLQLGSQLEF